MKTNTDQPFTSDSDVFWAEVAPCDHLVQLYEDDDVFLDSLEGFVSGGIRRGDASVVIATPAHRKGLERRLKGRESEGGARYGHIHRPRCGRNAREVHGR